MRGAPSTSTASPGVNVLRLRPLWYGCCAARTGGKLPRRAPGRDDSSRFAVFARSGATNREFLAVLASALDRRKQVVDLHASSEIWIHEPGLDDAVASDHESRRYWQRPAVVAVETSHIVIGEQPLDFAAEPDRQIEGKRIAIVEIRQNREWYARVRLEFPGILLRLRQDGDDLRP